MSAHGAPVRSRQKIPLSTRRSSTRGLPRTFVGNKGWITDHSKSVRSKRAITASCSLQKVNHRHRPGESILWVCNLGHDGLEEVAVRQKRKGSGAAKPPPPAGESATVTPSDTQELEQILNTERSDTSGCDLLNLNAPEE